MPHELTADRRATLRAVCDTVVPSLPRDRDPHGLWGRSASDVGADEAVAQQIGALPEELAAGLGQLLDAVAAQGFAQASQLSREQLLRNLALASGDAAGGVAALTSLTLFFAYGLPDAAGRNPNWPAFGYAGPASAPPQDERRLVPLVPDGDTTLEADVVIVGSGAGGGVIAGRLAKRGLRVVVLEAGGAYEEPDFCQLELWAYQHLFYRGGPTPTADQNVSVQAGSCLGGGTVINWTNCLRTKPWVREQWARDFGLSDVATEAFDAHMDAVWARLGVNPDCSDLNGPQERMRAGAEALGWSFRRTDRNADPARYDPVSAGYMGFGDQSGSKQSTAKTYLADAVAHGARILCRTRAERVLVEDGRAAGVAAAYADPETGASAAVTVRAPQVVVACGALESPALLLRTGIGGDAVGRHLRLHPCTATFGLYQDDQRAWWGPPHAGLVDEWANATGDGYGFLIEGAQYTTAVAASAIPFTSAADHKAAMEGFSHAATFIGLLRDQGGGRVSIDADGEAVHTYDLEAEPRDVALTRRALDAQVRCHEAAGAHTIHTMAEGLPTWRRGDDLEAYIARIQRIPLRAGGMRLFTAHQMGTCRMGADPATSVANPDGELHDTPGVWIGDASAFPTPSGTNPMITIMALAHRTADRIAAAAGAAAPAADTLTPA
jgi:choline dehydrogenase-like flavoprotein